MVYFVRCHVLNEVTKDEDKNYCSVVFVGWNRRRIAMRIYSSPQLTQNLADACSYLFHQASTKGWFTIQINRYPFFFGRLLWLYFFVGQRCKRSCAFIVAAHPQGLAANGKEYIGMHRLKTAAAERREIPVQTT